MQCHTCLALENAQKLFIRLYSRKHDWIFKRKINYEEFEKIELSTCMDSLINDNLLGTYIAPRA